MKFRSKRYKKVLNNIGSLKNGCEFSNAYKTLKENNSEKSDKIKLSFSLNWNKRQNGIRDFVSLPFPVKKEKIAIIDENISEDLKKNNNDEIFFIGIEELSKIVNKKKKKWGFEKILADSSISNKLKPFAKTLSLKKAFPNIKDGTLTSDLQKSISELKNGRIELRTDKNGNFHVLVGKVSFENYQIQENYTTILKKIISLKPSNWKGEYIKNITLSTSMSPGIKILL